MTPAERSSFRPAAILLVGSIVAGLAARPFAPPPRSGVAAAGARAVADVLWIRAAQDLPKGWRLPAAAVEWNFRRLRLALRLVPERTARASLAGMALSFWKRDDLAVRLLWEAWSRRPTDERLVVALGAAQALRRQDDPALAAQFLERACAFDDAPAVAWKLLAHARERAGDPAGALAAWETVDRRFGGRDPRDRTNARAEIARIRAGIPLPRPPHDGGV